MVQNNDMTFNDLIYLMRFSLVIPVEIKDGLSTSLEIFDYTFERFESLIKSMDYKWLLDKPGYKVLRECYKKYILDKHEADENTSRFRQFYLLESVLNAISHDIISSGKFGGLCDFYILFADIKRGTYEQLNFLRRQNSLTYPPRDPDEYIKNLRCLGKRSTRTLAKCDSTILDIIKGNGKLSDDHPMTRALQLLGGQSDFTRGGKNREEGKRNSASLLALLQKTLRKDGKLASCDPIDACALRLLAREICEAYLNERRKDLKKMQQKYFGGRGIRDLAIVKRVTNFLENRSHFEKINQIILQEDGELFFLLYLQRLAELYWIPKFEGCGEKKTFGEFIEIANLDKSKFSKSKIDKANAIRTLLNPDASTARRKAECIYADFYSIFGKDDTGIAFVTRQGTKPVLTNSARRALKWIDAVCTNGGYKNFKEDLFPASKATRDIPTIQPQLDDKKISLCIKEESLASCVKGLLNPKDDNDIIRNTIDLFRTLFESNKDGGLIKPFTDVQLSEYAHLDPFLTLIYAAKHEDSVNNKYDKSLYRYFFVMPIDPISEFEYTKQEHFALGLGYLEHSDPLPLSSDGCQKPDDRIIRLTQLVNTIAQPVTRERIEMDLKGEAERARRALIRAATAAIMGRNMSHNLGSHVLVYMDDKSDDKSKVLDEEFAANLKKLEKYKGHEDLTSEERTALEQIREIPSKAPARIRSIFNKYLQNRMDYIATVTSDWPVWTFPMNIYSDFILPFQKNYALLQNIARSESLTYRDIKFTCRIYDDKESRFKEIPKKKISEELKNWADKISVDEDELCTLGDIAGVIKSLTSPPTVAWVDIPASDIGIQAFYSILENLIRNAVKHGEIKKLMDGDGKKRKLDITIDLRSDSAWDYWQVMIYDNISTMDKGKVEKIKEHAGSFLKSDDQLDPEGWGIKEMKVATYFLNLRDPIDLINGKEDLFKPFLFKCQQRDLLAYEFRLYKPRYLLIVTSTNSNVEERRKPPVDVIDEELGIDRVNSIDDVLRFKFRHKFLLVFLPKGREMEIIRTLYDSMEYLPYRILLYGEDKSLSLDSLARGKTDALDDADIGIIKRRFCIIDHWHSEKVLVCPNNLSEIEDKQAMFFYVYGKWIRFLDRQVRVASANDSRYIIHMFLEQEHNEQPSENWEDWSEKWKADNFFDLEVYYNGDDREQKVLERVKSGGDHAKNKEICILRHGGGTIRKLSELLKKRSFHHENIEKQLPLFDLIVNVQSELHAKLLCYQIIESATLRIVIVDERLANQTCYTDADTLSVDPKWLLKSDDNLKHGLRVPTELNIEEKTSLLGERRTRIEKRLNEQAEIQFYKRILRVPAPDKANDEVSYKCVKAGMKGGEEGESVEETRFHFLCIHKGVLENIKLLTDGKKERWIKNLKRHFPFFIVHSGRGLKGEEISPLVKVAEFSTIYKYSYPEVSKCHLSQILLSCKKEGGKTEV